MLMRGEARGDTRAAERSGSVTPHCALRTAHSLGGQAMIEFLLTVPLLLLIVFLIVTFGKGFRLKQRAVVASRHAAWHTAQTGGVGLMQDFQEDFFSGDPTGSHGAVASPDDGKMDFEARLNLPAGVMSDYWADAAGRARGESRQRAAVDYEPPGSVYRYALERIGETTAREYQTWHWGDANFWQFFGERIMEEPTARGGEAFNAFDQAGQQGLSGVTDPVLRQALVTDMDSHRNRLDRYFSAWISSWKRG